jgi:branched-chain amino acid transport system substrate-binding protein
MTLTRRAALTAAAILPFARAHAADPVVLGVSGPLTGPNAQYGAQWKQGFDLALEEVGGAVGPDKRPLVYQFEDSQSDPRQSVAIAQKFAADKRIVMELGDFSSPASMAASPIYQRAGLVQFGFTNSHPDFTKTGDYMWSNSLSQSDEQPALAQLLKDLGFKRPAVIHQNTDWGRTSRDILVKAAKADGLEVTAVEGFLPDEKDFRPTLVRVRDSNPDGIALIAYYSDAALIARQLRQQGMKETIAAVSSVYSPKLIELGGDAVEGMYTQSAFSPEDPRPEVRKFVDKFRAKYGRDPDTFNVGAYDTMILAHTLIGQYGTDRKAIRDGLEKVSFPSVVYGPDTRFDPQTRRVSRPRFVRLVVRGGKFVVWDGQKRA